MWTNSETAAFTEWLKEYNEKLPQDKKIGFYGLDLYSFGESMNSIIEYLEKNDPEALEIPKTAMAFFEPYSKDEVQYYDTRAFAFVLVLFEK